jgi:hypothetical protein
MNSLDYTLHDCERTVICSSQTDNRNGAWYSFVEIAMQCRKTHTHTPSTKEFIQAGGRGQGAGDGFCFLGLVVCYNISDVWGFGHSSWDR